MNIMIMLQRFLRNLRLAINCWKFLRRTLFNKLKRYFLLKMCN
ncbi:Hypothetical protein ETEE_2323 [Edwardsiella anguillarum ET080813]|uniref:Uncharacterized protein n=1 Tax=Edwardsiella anguillarum ET080813 TaxID=667120 RepID=A0A076LJP0_9GAMM|nr:Hypothetical protein ETEE_2323 [Edwardsiella anguillarum ET080813]